MARDGTLKTGLWSPLAIADSGIANITINGVWLWDKETIFARSGIAVINSDTWNISAVGIIKAHNNLQKGHGNRRERCYKKTSKQNSFCL
jgi:hypothetical protein